MAGTIPKFSKERAVRIGKEAVSKWFADRDICGGIQTAPLVAAIEAVYDDIFGEGEQLSFDSGGMDGFEEGK